jgi:hypothetical protein
MNRSFFARGVLFGAFLLVSVFAAGEDSCTKLMSLSIANTKIGFAQIVEAGTFAGPPTPNSGRDLTAPYKKVPSFCRVVAEATPTADSDIKLEVWLPMAEWNGRLLGLGNGGFAGVIDYPGLAAGVSKGFVSTATNTGHIGSPIAAGWAIGHPEKVIDFGYRGIHEMTRVAKEVIVAFYGKVAQHAYFAGCSDGGREALMEAQRFPADYDGILAGAPANYWTALLSLAAADSQALTLDAASWIPPEKIPVIANAVNDACDQLDGVHDGILNDPRQCHFDPATIQCKAGQNSNECLAAPQVIALKKLYAGIHDTHGREIFPGYLPGAEEGSGGWTLWITGQQPKNSLMFFFQQNYFSSMVYEDPAWDYKTFTVDDGLKSAEAKTATALNAIDADLKPFAARGGKLIMYHGWNDPAIPARNTINYYESVAKKMGQGATDSFLRLYMVPGMQHCADGPGTDSFGQSGRLEFDDPQNSVSGSLVQWVEKGVAPSTIIASKLAGTENSKMTRPLCVYPQAAKYTGKGDTNDAASFVCETPKQ